MQAFIPKRKSYTCSHCGQEISTAEYLQHKTCRNIKCRNAQYREARKQAKAHEIRLKKQAAIRDQRVRAAVGCLPNGNAVDQILVAPSNTRRYINLAEKRRRKFRDSLYRELSEAMVSSEPIERMPDHLETPNNLEGSICATCRGRCCRDGGDHAFIDAATLRRFMDTNQQLRPIDVANAYLERLPHRSYEDSCVFHTDTGCMLPREMRSKICNEFVCNPMKDIREEIDSIPSGSRLAIVTLNDDDEVQRINTTNL